MRDGSNLVIWLVRTMVYLTVGFVLSKFIDDFFWSFALTIVPGSTINFVVVKQFREYFG